MKIILRHYDYYQTEDLVYRILKTFLHKSDAEDIADKISCPAIRSFDEYVNKVAKFFQKKDHIEIHDHDLWNLDYGLSKIIVPCLKKFKQNLHGNPVDILEREKSVPKHIQDNFEAWKWIIDEMIWSFESVIDELGDNEYDYYKDGKFERKLYEEFINRQQRGFKFFGKYYLNLWD